MQKSFVAIHNIPSPYRLHLFDALHQALRQRGIQFHVHFMSHGHKERPLSWRNARIPFPHTFWRDFGPRLGNLEAHFNPEMLRHLRSSPTSDHLLVGSAWYTLTGVLASLIVPRRKGVVWIESNTKTPGMVHGLAGAYKRLLLNRYDYVAVPGRDGGDYLELLHGDRKRRAIAVRLPNLVEEERFRPRAADDERELTRLRSRLELAADDQVAICPARLVPVKGIQEFFGAISPALLKGWKILIVGEGPLKAAIQAQLQRDGFSPYVHLENFVSYEDMPSLYAIASLLLLPSLYDPNPLSVVEAMHSGLPLLLSDRVGNFPEALNEGANGWGFNPRISTEIREAAEKAFRSTPRQLHLLGENSRERARASWDTKRSIRGFLDAIGAE